MNRRTLYQYIAAFLFGAVIIFPLMNQSGVISIYEALLGIWLTFMVPAYLGYRSLSRTGNKKAALIMTVVLYLMGTSLYSLVEPIIAGYNIGTYIFLIPVPASLIVMVPSMFIYRRSRYAKPKDGLPLDESLTNWLASMVKASDPSPPEVVQASQPRRIGATFASHTDGTVRKILIAEDAREIFDEEELRAAVLKAYYELKSRAAEKFVYKLNYSVMIYVDAIILLSAFANTLSISALQVALLLALACVVFGFIVGFPFLIRHLVKRKDFASDSRTVTALNDSTALKSYIRKAVDNYIMSPMATPRRQARAIAYQRKLAMMRIMHLDTGKAKL